jgi:hypothetical protein
MIYKKMKKKERRRRGHTKVEIYRVGTRKNNVSISTLLNYSSGFYKEIPFSGFKSL